MTTNCPISSSWWEWRPQDSFDVKNLNPRARHGDVEGDMSTAEKRRARKERLGCEYIAVNILEMEPSMDGAVLWAHRLLREGDAERDGEPWKVHCLIDMVGPWHMARARTFHARFTIANGLTMRCLDFVRHLKTFITVSFQAFIASLVLRWPLFDPFGCFAPFAGAGIDDSGQPHRRLPQKMSMAVAFLGHYW